MTENTSQSWLLGARPDLWWTGLRPDVTPGFDPKSGTLHSLPQLQFENITRQEIFNYFNNSWTLTELLFSGLQGEEAFTVPPKHQLRHPLAFYYGHPAVLYVNKLRLAGLLPGPVDEHFENLFEVGVDEMSWDDMSKNEMQWPAIREITEYRRQIYKLIRNLILEDPRLDPVKHPITQESPAWGLVMGFEHERIHFETSSVLMRELPLKYLSRPTAWPKTEAKSGEAKNYEGLVAVEKGSVSIGKETAFPTFGWDNEYGRREQEVGAFEASRALITNGDFLEFVKDGGYLEARFWSADGWGWRGFRNSKWPTFWVQEGPSGLHQYQIRTIFEKVPFEKDWPVVVNFHEAQAYCAWKTRKEKSKRPFRLISEAEHHRLRTLAGREAQWNSELKNGSELSAYAHGSNGIADLYGNVWQWCEDEFNPLPQFKTNRLYEDFSVPCFDGRHQMIMGGSFASTGDEASRFARFHFRPHFFQHAGFRMARSAESSPRTSAVRLSLKNLQEGSDYESGELLAQYLLLHFGTPENILPFAGGPRDALNFPQRCAEAVTQTARQLKIPMESALDIGCAVGGASFALSESYQKVIGIDLSSSFIATADQMKTRGALEFDRKDQGDLSSRVTVYRPQKANPDRVHFQEGDACELSADLRNFDAVLMANLLCRLPNPRSCLNSMAGPQGVVKIGGLLVLASPYSWLESHTPASSWLGGQVQDGFAKFSEEEVKKILSENFELLSETEMPLLIREHARKYQYIVPHFTIWQRKK